ncbi:MAG: hypothetical protein ACJASQ_001542 [Crocinitomicaceae bacterium]|jgi:hypothetical protein
MYAKLNKTSETNEQSTQSRGGVSLRKGSDSQNLQTAISNSQKNNQAAQLQEIANNYSMQQQPIQRASLTLNGATSNVSTSISSELDPKNAPSYGQSSSDDSDLDAIMATLPTDPTHSNKKKFVKGHLLNDNLGGMANKDNLYPITAQANSDHKTKVENKIKTYIEGGVGDPITYTVNVTNASVVKKTMKQKSNSGAYVEIDTPKATFTCKTVGGTGFTNIDEPIASEAESRA